MMHHQYWVTKKTVLKKFGTKEDECITASDAELDAKLELFQSISDSCLHLQRVLDQYQERLCILAQEENCLGKFLKEAGKGSDAAGKHMISAGKAISYCGQQRLSVRSPLVRLYHEVETFRGRAVSDMRATVSAMEKARLEYRAALSWMKSTSSQLDPDTGRGLDNFRKAQRQVRESKKLFDKLTIDVLEKIDLLAAARCNMFSHVLSNYQSAFQNFSTKVSQTLLATAETINSAPQYEFSILKELSMKLGEGEVESNQKTVIPQDKDQMLFFQDEYKDDDPGKLNPDNISENTEKMTNHPDNQSREKRHEDSTFNLIDTSLSYDNTDGININTDLAGLQLGAVLDNLGLFMPSQLLEEASNKKLIDTDTVQSNENTEKLMLENPTKDNKSKKDEKAAWFKLFAELDPLANPDSLPGSNTNQSHAA